MKQLFLYRHNQASEDSLLSILFFFLSLLSCLHGHVTAYHGNVSYHYQASEDRHLCYLKKKVCYLVYIYKHFIVLIVAITSTYLITYILLQ